MLNQYNISIIHLVKQFIETPKHDYFKKWNPMDMQTNSFNSPYWIFKQKSKDDQNGPIHSENSRLKFLGAQAPLQLL